MALVLGRKRKPKTSKKPRRAEKLVPTQTAGTEQLLAYPAHGVVTCQLRISAMQPNDPELAWDRRYENARASVADWINACRRMNRLSFSRPTFDVWLGQECGVELGSTMKVTIASNARLPELRLLELLRERPEGARRYWDWGQQPIELGAFPELRVDRGTIAHTWRLDGPFLALASERFRRWHGLAPEVNDPYRQMLMGAPEPGPFDWTLLRSERSEPEDQQHKVFLFEVITDSEERKGLRISSPDKVVSIVDDAYNLDDQLELANVDIISGGFESFQRLQHVRYVRPALRAHCERLGRAIPDWLADDSTFNALSEQKLVELFGVKKLGIRPFRPLRKIEGIRVVRVRDNEPGGAIES